MTLNAFVSTCPNSSRIKRMCTMSSWSGTRKGVKQPLNDAAIVGDLSRLASENVAILKSNGLDKASVVA